MVAKLPHTHTHADPHTTRWREIGCSFNSHVVVAANCCTFFEAPPLLANWSHNLARVINSKLLQPTRRLQLAPCNLQTVLSVPATVSILQKEKKQG